MECGREKSNSWRVGRPSWIFRDAARMKTDRVISRADWSSRIKLGLAFFSAFVCQFFLDFPINNHSFFFSFLHFRKKQSSETKEIMLSSRFQFMPEVSLRACYIKAPHPVDGKTFPCHFVTHFSFLFSFSVVLMPSCNCLPPPAP